MCKFVFASLFNRVFETYLNNFVSKIIHIDFKADFYYNIFRSFWKTRGITDYDNYTGYR